MLALGLPNTIGPTPSSDILPSLLVRLRLLVFIFVCVCVRAPVCVQVLVHVCICAYEGQRLMLAVFSNCFPPDILR